MRWWGAVLVIITASAFRETLSEAAWQYDDDLKPQINTNIIPKLKDEAKTIKPKADQNVTYITTTIPGSVKTALALQHVLTHLVNASQVSHTKIVPAPKECDIPKAADDDKCLESILGQLYKGNVTIAVLPVSSMYALPSKELNFLDIMEQGDITDRTRRACIATKTETAFSLLDLDDPKFAANYHLPDSVIDDEIFHLNRHSIVRNNITCENNAPLFPERCRNTNCTTILTSEESEACVFAEVVRRHQLYAVIKPLSDDLVNIAEAITIPTIICDWAPEFSDLYKLKSVTLGPPPCEPPNFCPFETRRLIAFVNYKHLKQSAINALSMYKIESKQMRGLSRNAIELGPEKAADLHWKEHPLQIRGEVRVIVMVPGPTKRHVYYGALPGVAGIHPDLVNGTKFITVVYNDYCQTTTAMSALQNEQKFNGFRSLSAVAGPLCADVWSTVATQTTTMRLPLLAYTPQVPTADAVEDQKPLQLLGAGDARDGVAALGAFASRMGWRRFGALSEYVTRPLLNSLGVPAKFDVDVQLQKSNTFEQHLEQISEWAKQIVREYTRVIYLCVEDARLARAAVCAAKTARTSTTDGDHPAAWLVCSILPPDWWQPAGNESCTFEELKEMTTGFFFVMPEWASNWISTVNNATTERTEVEHNMQRACQQYTKSKCTKPLGPYEALLYDLLTVWITALRDLLEKYRIAVDEMHDPIYIRSLIDFVTKGSFIEEFVGLTGTFNWTMTKHAYIRSSPIILSQWRWHGDIGKHHVVGKWSDGSLDLKNTALIWYTHDGKAPDDGSDRCALQGLADGLHTDCRTAYVALGAILAALLVAILATLAMYCKRRAEREYRKRLAALGMRPLGLLKPAGLDRWEVPRERVVINRKLGTGAFGTVYGGHALLADNRGWTAVAVKTLKAGATTEEKLDFLSEAEAMKRFDHKNVVRLLAVITKTEPVCTVMEFMLYGDLKNYLLARRHLAMGCGPEEEGSAGGESDEASPRRLTSMALDVARALSYLAQLRYVHRDVAARNCLVSARRTVKLADFGMTRLVFENDYYRFSRKGMLPVRWMAPESLALGVFSPASDVWSFGVLLYEIVTFGSLPFQGLSNSEVLSRVKGGHTLELPPGLKPQLEGLIKSCWQHDSKMRPTASEVAAYLADAPRLLTPCLDVPLDALPLEADPPWKLPRDQAEARWISWAAPASAATDTTYLSTEGTVPLDTDSFLP